MLSKSCSYCRLRGQDRRYLNGENENLESHCLAKVALTSFLKNPTPDFLDGVNNSLIASKTRLVQCDSAIFFSLSQWPLGKPSLKKKKNNKMTFVILGGGGGQKFSKCHLFKSCV